MRWGKPIVTSTPAYLLRFTCFEEISWYQHWFCGSALMKLLNCVLHALRRSYQCTNVGCAGVPAWSFCIAFYTLWGDISAPKLVAGECRHEAFAFDFTRFEAISVHQSRLRGSTRMKLLHCVLQALRRYQCTNVGCVGVLAWSFTLSFARFEAISVHQCWLRRSAGMKLLHCVLHALRWYQCTKVGCVGVPTWSFCIVFYRLWGDTSVTKLVAGSAGMKLLHCVLHALRRYQCTQLVARECRRECFCIVFYVLWDDISASKLVARECRHEAFALCFRRFEVISIHQSWLRSSACMELLHCVLDTLRRYQCNKVGCTGVSAWSFCIVFYTLWGDVSAPTLVARERRHESFALCFTRFETISVHQRTSRLGASAGMKLLRFVSYAFRRYQCTKVGCTGVPTMSFCIVFYTLWGDTSVTTFVAWECRHEAFALCFTRFEAISVHQSWLRGSASMKLLYCVVHALRRYQWESPYGAFALCFTHFEAVPV